MEYNEIKDILKSAKAPDIPLRTAEKAIKAEDMKSFIEDLKLSDIRNRKMLKSFNIMYVIAIIFYILLFVLNPDKGLGLQERLIGSGYISALLIYAYYFKTTKNTFQVQYLDEPTIKFLSEAEKRYRFWNRKSFILLPALLFIDIAASFSFFINYYPEDKNLLTGIVISQFIFLAICCISFWIGKKMWIKRSESIYENIVLLLTSFREETSENT